MNKKPFLLSVFGAALAGSAITLGSYHFYFNSLHGDTYVNNGVSSHYKLTGNQVLPGNLDFTYAAEVSTPTVVHITTYQKVTQNLGYGNYQNQQMDDIFRQFFGDSYGNPYQQQQPQKQNGKEEEQEQKAGSGSGVIFSADGYIVTNNHVIKGADKIEVVLNDKRRYIATLIGTDPTTDLAVLKIDEKGLPYIKYGDSEKMKIGEWVLAVGNPFDLTSTVTAGIISAKARNINILKDKENLAIESFIQTDAAVNPGNSGGALVNLQGELIGINTAIATPNGTFTGYSFAVPSNLVNKVIDDLIQYGEVQRALLGVSITEVTSQLKEEKGLDKLEGVYVSEVRENSAAEAAGLKVGDVILKINNTPVNSSSELQENVALFRPGNKVNVTYKRKGAIETAVVTLKNKLGNTDVVKKSEKSLVTVYNSQIRELTDEEKTEFGVAGGLKIISVGDGRFANAGISKGFVITKVDNKPFTDPNALLSYLQSHKGTLKIEGLYNKNIRSTYEIGY